MVALPKQRQAFEEKVGIVNDFASAARHDVRSQSAGGNHCQRRPQLSLHPFGQTVQHGCGAEHGTIVQCLHGVAADEIARRFGGNGGQLGRAGTDGPQTGLNARHDEPAQEFPLGGKHIVGCGGAQIHRHAGQRIQGGGRGRIGDAVTPHTPGLVHPEGQTGIQCAADNQRLFAGQTAAGVGQRSGQTGHHTAYNNTFTRGTIHPKPPQQKFQFGGIFVARAAGTGDHTGGEQHLPMAFPHKASDADVGISDVHRQYHTQKAPFL